MFPSLKSKAINFLKLRYAYGSSGNFPDPYQTRNYLLSTNNAFGGGNGTNPAVLNTQALSTFLANPQLKPEVYKENEFGFEGKFFNNRVTLNTSYFLRTTKDQIVPSVYLDPATGYRTTITNIAKLDRNGLEIELAITPIKTNDFRWNINNVFYRERTEVKQLPEGMNKLVIAGYTNLGNFAVVGEPLGIMMGTGIRRDANGNPIVLTSGTNAGSYDVTKDIVKIGNPNPDYTYSFISNMFYKNFELSLKMDYQKGGDIYSNTAASLLARGNVLPFDRTSTYVLPGVKPDGTVNDIQVNPFHYFFDNYFYSDEIRVFDATHLRLSEISLGYNLPKKFLQGSPISDLNISIIGNNLWYRAFNFPKELNFDPQVSSTGVGNGRGFDFLTNVPIRRFGMSVKISF